MSETVVLPQGSARGAALPMLAGPPPPTMIRLGERILAAAVATARQLQRASNARMIQVPGAASMIPVTHAAQVAAALEHGITP